MNRKDRAMNRTDIPDETAESTPEPTKCECCPMRDMDPCIEEKCAWWNVEYSECAVASLGQLLAFAYNMQHNGLLTRKAGY